MLKQDKGPAIRFSSLGKTDRQVWYAAHPDGTEEKFSGQHILKFQYGDIIEQYLLYLIKESGHDVKGLQEPVEVLGIKGSADAIIDDVVVDIKSASPFSFQKFKRNEVLENDPFGYVKQLSGYSEVLNPGEAAAWLAMDKVSGELCLTSLSSSVIKDNLPEPRIEELKTLVEKENPPDRCHPEVPEGKAGNLRLGTACSYCPHKHRCWPGLRTFGYSTGPKFFTKIVKTPEVPEYTKS